MNMRGLSCRPLDSCEEMVAERRVEYYTTYLGQQGQDALNCGKAAKASSLRTVGRDDPIAPHTITSSLVGRDY